METEQPNNPVGEGEAVEQIHRVPALHTEVGEDERNISSGDDEEVSVIPPQQNEMNTATPLKNQQKDQISPVTDDHQESDGGDASTAAADEFAAKMAALDELSEPGDGGWLTTAPRGKDPYPHRHFHPMRPVCNKLLAFKWSQMCSEKDREKMLAVKSTLNNTPPRKYPHLRTKPKKHQMEEGTFFSPMLSDDSILMNTSP